MSCSVHHIIYMSASFFTDDTRKNIDNVFTIVLNSAKKNTLHNEGIREY